MMQDLMRIMSREKPPHTSLRRGQGRGRDGAPQLVAINSRSDVFMLCEGNVLKYVSLVGSGGDAEEAGGGGQFAEEDAHTVVFDDGSGVEGINYMKKLPEKQHLKRMEFNDDGDCLVIWGDYYVGVVQVPRVGPQRRRGSQLRSSELDGGSSSISRLFRLIDVSRYAVDIRKCYLADVVWHPLSPSCLTMLCVGGEEGMSDTAFVCLQTLNSDEPEQEVWLDECMVAEGAKPVSLAHGGEQGWQRFTTWVLMDNGNVMALCPLLPKEAALRRADLLDLMEGIDEEMEELETSLEMSQPSGRNSGEDDADQESGTRENPVQQELKALQEQKAWLVNTFGGAVGGGFGEDLEDEDDSETDDDQESRVDRRRRIWAAGAGGGGDVLSEEVDDGFVNLSHSTPPRRRQGRVRMGGGEWVKVLHPNRLRSWQVAPQDLVSTLTESPVSNEAGPACSLACVTGAAPLRDLWGATGGVGLADSAVLARAYVTGQVDLIFVIGGVEPKWIHKGGGEEPAGVTITDYYSPVLECIDLLADEGHDDHNDGGGQEEGGEGGVARGRLKSTGMGPMLLMDPLRPWTLHVVTPYRIVTLVLSWGEQLEQMGQELEELVGTGGDAPAKMNDRLLKALHGRKESSVVDILCLMPAGSEQDDSTSSDLNPHCIVGCAVARSPIVGHLVVGRLACGSVELVNLTVRQAQTAASERQQERSLQLQVDSSTKQQGKGGPPTSLASESTSKLVEQLQPFSHVTRELRETLESGISKHRYHLKGANMKLADADEGAVRSFVKEVERLNAGVVDIVEQLHVKTQSRLSMLRDCHQFQQEQLQSLHQEAAELKAGQARLQRRVAAAANLGSSLASRAAGVLEGAQVMQPRLTRAEMGYRKELERWDEQCSRWEVIVDKLSRLGEQQVLLDKDQQGLVKRLEAVQMGEPESDTAFELLRAQTQRIAQSMQKLKEVKEKVGSFNA